MTELLDGGKEVKEKRCKRKKAAAVAWRGGFFDRAIDLGLGPGLDWGWRAGESTCSAALQRIGGDGDGNGSQGGPSGSPSSPNIPNPSRAPKRQLSLGQGKVCLYYRELCPLPQKELEPSAGWRDGTLLPTSLVVQRTGSL